MITPKMIFKAMTLTIMKKVKSNIFLPRKEGPGGSGFIESAIPPPFLNP